MGWKTGFKWIKWQVNRFWSQRKGDNKFVMRKNVLGRVRGDWFLYICLSSLIINLVLDYYSVSFLIFWSLPHGGSLILYSSLWTILILHLLIVWAFTWVSVPSNTLFGQGSTVQESFSHKCGQKSSFDAFNAVVATFS